MKIKYKSICYVLLRVNESHPITENRHDLIWYPENAMTLLQTIQYRPYIKSIVTENPWLIAMYDRQDVRVWDIENKKWKIPNYQTYAASFSMIMDSILGIHQTIPSIPLDGGEAIQELKNKTEDSYRG